MKIAIAGHSKDKSSASLKGIEQSRFDKLWTKVKKQKQANEKLQESLTELSVVYREKILPVEKQLLSPYVALVLKLLDFFRRKSLSQWQRQELGVWIMENIEMITPLDQEKSRDLTEQYYQLLANHLDMDVDELQEQIEQADSFDEFDDFFRGFEGVFAEDEKLAGENDGQDDLFGFIDEEHEQAKEGFAGQSIDCSKDQPASDSDKWLKKLFRRTANALHPDKEQDEILKNKKQQLMAALLAARESNDIYTIINLYTEHVDAADLQVGPEVMETLCRQLQQQLDDMEMLRYQLLDSNPLFLVLYNNIYHSNKNTQAKNIDKYMARISSQAEDLAALSHSIRNLADLKEILKYRSEQSRYDDWMGF